MKLKYIDIANNLGILVSDTATIAQNMLYYTINSVNNKGMIGIHIGEPYPCNPDYPYWKIVAAENDLHLDCPVFNWRDKMDEAIPPNKDKNDKIYSTDNVINFMNWIISTGIKVDKMDEHGNVHWYKYMSASKYDMGKTENLLNLYRQILMKSPKSIEIETESEFNNTGSDTITKPKLFTNSQNKEEVIINYILF